MADKPSKHVVKAGEQHVPRLAFDHGMRSINPIWDAPENAELRRQRVNPNTLAVNDVVVIPADDPKTEPRSTQQVNVFTVVAEPLHLVLRLQDEARRPFANRACHFVEGTSRGVGLPAQRVRGFDVVTSAAGVLDVIIGRNAKEGELTIKATTDAPPLPEVRIRLIIGALDPVNTESGQRARLNNLGYFAGFTDKDTAQLRWAIEEFQQDQRNLKVNGRSDDEDTFNRLAQEHGDLLTSERVPRA